LAASDNCDFKKWGCTKSFTEIRFLLNDELVYHESFFFYEWVYDVCSTVGARVVSVSCQVFHLRHSLLARWKNILIFLKYSNPIYTFFPRNSSLNSYEEGIFVVGIKVTRPPLPHRIDRMWLNYRLCRQHQVRKSVRSLRVYVCVATPVAWPRFIRLDAPLAVYHLLTVF